MTDKSEIIDLYSETELQAPYLDVARSPETAATLESTQVHDVGAMERNLQDTSLVSALREMQPLAATHEQIVVQAAFAVAERLLPLRQDEVMHDLQEELNRAA